jgi:hypothetical protein
MKKLEIYISFFGLFKSYFAVSRFIDFDTRL